MILSLVSFYLKLVLPREYEMRVHTQDKMSPSKNRSFQHANQKPKCVELTDVCYAVLCKCANPP